MSERQLITAARAALLILLLAVIGNVLGLIPTAAIGVLIIAGLLLSGWLLVTGHIPARHKARKHEPGEFTLPVDFTPPHEFALPDNPQADAYVYLDEEHTPGADESVPLAALLNQSASDIEARHE